MVARGAAPPTALVEALDGSLVKATPDFPTVRGTAAAEGARVSRTVRARFRRATAATLAPVGVRADSPTITFSPRAEARAAEASAGAAGSTAATAARAAAALAGAEAGPAAR